MFAGAIRNANIEACQLGSKPATSRVSRVQCPRMCLDLVEAGPAMLYQGEMPQDCYTLSFVMRSPRGGRSFNFGADYSAGHMAFFPPGTVLDASSSGGSVDAILTVPVEEFHAALATYFPELPERILRRGCAMRVGPAEGACLRGLLTLIDSLIRTHGKHPIGAGDCCEFKRALLPAFLTALRSGSSAIIPQPKLRVARRDQRLRDARDFIHDHQREPIQTEDLCAALGLSERGIQNLFHDLVGISPATFLRHQRLHSVHRRLLQIDPAPGKVKEVALEAGFWHLGHFSHNYRVLFGEKPSDTLGRADRGVMVTLPC